MNAINLNVGDIVYRYENNAAVEQRVKKIVFHCDTRYPEVSLFLLSAATYEVRKFSFSPHNMSGIFSKIDRQKGVISDEVEVGYGEQTFRFVCEKFHDLNAFIGELFVNCTHGDAGDYGHHVALKRYVWRNNCAEEKIQKLYDTMLIEDECGHRIQMCSRIESSLEGFVSKEECEENNIVKIISF